MMKSYAYLIKGSIINTSNSYLFLLIVFEKYYEAYFIRAYQVCFRSIPKNAKSPSKQLRLTGLRFEKFTCENQLILTKVRIVYHVQPLLSRGNCYTCFLSSCKVPKYFLFFQTPYYNHGIAILENPLLLIR